MLYFTLSIALVKKTSFIIAMLALSVFGELRNCQHSSFYLLPFPTPFCLTVPLDPDICEQK